MTLTGAQYQAMSPEERRKILQQNISQQSNITPATQQQPTARDLGMSTYAGQTVESRGQELARLAGQTTPFTAGQPLESAQGMKTSADWAFINNNAPAPTGDLVQDQMSRLSWERDQALRQAEAVTKATVATRGQMEDQTLKNELEQYKRQAESLRNRMETNPEYANMTEEERMMNMYDVVDGRMVERETPRVAQEISADSGRSPIRTGALALTRAEKMDSYRQELLKAKMPPKPVNPSENVKYNAYGQARQQIQKDIQSIKTSLGVETTQDIKINGDGTISIIDKSSGEIFDPVKRAEARFREETFQEVRNAKEKHQKDIDIIKSIHSKSDGTLTEQGKRILLEQQALFNRGISEFEEKRGYVLENIIKQEKARQEQVEKAMTPVRRTIDGVEEIQQMTLEQQVKLSKQEEYANMINNEIDKSRDTQGNPTITLAEADRRVTDAIKDGNSAKDLLAFQNFARSQRAMSISPEDMYAEAYSITEGDGDKALKLISKTYNDKIAKLAQEEWLKEKGFDPEVVTGIKEKQDKQSEFLKGALRGGVALDYMNQVEVESPDKAKRLYQRALIDGVYEDDPIMEALVRQRVNDMTDKQNNLPTGTTVSMNSLIREYDIATPTRKSEIINDLRMTGRFEQFEAARMAIMGSNLNYTELAMQGITATLRNSNVELERFQSGLLAYKELGLSPYEARNAMLGYRIMKDEDKQFAEYARRAYMMTDQSDTSGLSKMSEFINNEDYYSALLFIENEGVPQTADWRFETTKPILETTQRIKQLINEVGSSYMGQLDKRMFDAIKGTTTPFFQKQVDSLFKGNSEKRAKAVELGRLLASVMAEERRFFAGTAVTETELKQLAPMLADMKNQPQVAFAKIDSMEKEILRKYNANREKIGLVRMLDAVEVVDPELFVNANMQKASQITQTPFVDPFQSTFDDWRATLDVSAISPSSFSRETADIGQQEVGGITNKYEGRPTSIGQDKDSSGNEFPSYGSYQMNRGVASRFAKEQGFRSADPNSEEFRREWMERANRPDFHEKERDFVTRTMFEPHVQKVKNDIQLPDAVLQDRRIQELLFDLAVNAGAGNTVFADALTGKSPRSIEEILELVKQERIKRAKGHPMEKGMINRYEGVNKDLLSFNNNKQ